MEITTEQLMEFLSPLIEEGRLTGNIMIDGFVLLDSESQNVVEPPAKLYDQYGFSKSMDQYGCVSHRKLDERIDNWLANGDEFEQIIAKGASQMFGLLIPGREYEDDIITNMKYNSNALWALAIISGGHANFAGFAVYDPYWIHVDTGEMKHSLDIEERNLRPKKWVYNKNRRGDSIPNHRSVGMGNYVNPKHPMWEEMIAGRMIDELLDDMERSALRLRKRSEDGPNVVRPTPSPEKK